ncbi:hypothetical protein ABZ235_33770 [Streptomyces canus]|uniref:hypothetical protein n=1 Tax=Streptomyces canus TaxID=58343 RepID=UPI0033BB08B0
MTKQRARTTARAGVPDECRDRNSSIIIDTLAQEPNRVDMKVRMAQGSSHV